MWILSAILIWLIGTFFYWSLLSAASRADEIMERHFEALQHKQSS